MKKLLILLSLLAFPVFAQEYNPDDAPHSGQVCYANKPNIFLQNQTINGALALTGANGNITTSGNITTTGFISAGNSTGNISAGAVLRGNSALYIGTTGGNSMRLDSGTNGITYMGTASNQNQFYINGAGNIAENAVPGTTSWHYFQAATTADSSMNIPSGTAPTTPNNGDVWNNGTHFYVQEGGSTYQLDQQVSAAAGTGLTYSGSTLSSNAEQTISYQPGLLSAVNATKGVYGKFVKASTVDNIEGSAITFSCVSNPTITMTNCHTDTSCATSPTTIGTVTVTAAGQAFDGTITSASIAAGEYVAWSITAGTCASLDISATSQIHSN